MMQNARLHSKNMTKYTLKFIKWSFKFFSSTLFSYFIPLYKIKKWKTLTDIENK